MATITGVLQDTFPPRALITVSGLIAASTDILSIYREALGVRTALRGAQDVDPAGQDAVVRVDDELPFGVSVHWIAVLDLTTEITSSTVTGVIEKVAVSDAISGDAAEVVIVAWPNKTYSRTSTAFQVGGRTVVVSGPRTGFTGQIDIVTETDSARVSFDSLMTSATSGVVQIRQSGGYSGVDCYVAVRTDTETRWSQDGSDQRRRWSLDATEVDPWPLALEAQGFTLEDLSNAYPGTLDDIDNDFATLLLIAQADLSP